jgi:nucleotide-binding universal stress UspA family protein
MKVLIAVDSSIASQRVLEEVAARPWPGGTAFSVVTAVDVAPFAALPSFIQGAKTEGEKIVKAGAERLVRASQDVGSQVFVGNPRKAVSAYAVEWGADLILVGSHGHSAIGRFLLGSVAQGILRAAPCSVEVVRFPSDGAAPSSHPMKVLLATDGSDCSLIAAHSVAARPWPTETVFQVLSVEELGVIDAAMAGYAQSDFLPASLLEELQADASAHALNAINTARKALLQEGRNVLDQQPIPAGHPRSAILDSAQAWPADLIVLGSHGRRGIDRLLMGSVAESVALHAHCSVEVVRK